MYRYSVPCNPRITLAAFLAHFFLQDYREGATPFSPAGRFQSTCPRRGTTIPDSKLEDSDDWFQSTLPRGERRIMPGKLPRMQSVSIHAPTRGATAILAKNSLSFSAKNHKTIFLQPNCSFSICSFSKKLRYLCIFQSANPSTISCPLPIRAFALLHNQSIVYCNSSVDTYVLYFCLILISQIIKSQTINTLINSVC